MAYLQPPPSHVLQELITREYPRLGLNQHGLFIGATIFKERLAEEYPEYPIITITPVLKAMLKKGALPLTTKFPVSGNVRNGKGKENPISVGKGNGNPVPVGKGNGNPVPVGKGNGNPVPVGKGNGNPVPVGKGNRNPGPVGRETAGQNLFESLDITKWIQEMYSNIYREPDGTLASRHKIERTLIGAIPAGPKKRTRKVEDLIFVFLRDTFRAEEERGERSPRTMAVPIYPNAKIAAAFGSREEEEENGEAQAVPSLGDQMFLLGDTTDQNQEPSDLMESDIKNSLLFTANVIEKNKKLLPQYGLLGTVFPNGTQTITDARLFVNTNHPFSVFCCGLQGAGKSHSLSCLIENCLIPTPVLGSLKRPLAAMVFHFSQYTSRQNFRPCEAAFIACPHPSFEGRYSAVPVPVTVLVSGSNYASLRPAYSQIPGVTVKPLLLRPQDLNIGSMLTLMAITQSENPPLYISNVTKILREMAAESADFDFHEFKHRLNRVDLLPAQRRPLEQRIDLLESFLDLEGTNDGFDFPEGSITIVDLSCPFVDESTACVLFNICLGIFLQDTKPGVGKVLAVDEAHKYITNTPASRVLTGSLLQLIRQKRHYGARIIISTQEPTIDHRLIELCSLTLIHRFTSPEWFKILQKHLSVLDDDKARLFEKIVNLRVGEGFVFCPSAVIPSEFFANSLEPDYGSFYGIDDGNQTSAKEEKLGGRFLRIKTRQRLTADGGKSIVSV